MSNKQKSLRKRGKPSYIYSIIGVSVVLFLFGIVGWFFINLKKVGDNFKENIQVHTYLNRDASKGAIDSLKTYISSLSYTKQVEYVTKEMAIQRWNEENDSTWKQFLDENPLPESIDFYIKADYVSRDSLNLLSSNLSTLFPNVISEFQFPTETVSKVSNYVKTAGLIFLIVAIILTFFVVLSIDNTIRLAMYSNRFIIKTMQMVGATRWFITKPIDQRAIINGLISSGIAIFAIKSSVSVIEAFTPGFEELKKQQNGNELLLLFIGITLLGITISVVSTHRSVLKYLKMKLDDLY